jgi:tetratricopeptide (TPR) repeat protein
MKRLIFIIALVTQFHLGLSEDNQNNPFLVARGLIEEGKYEAAISVLTPVTRSPTADNAIRGRALTIIGFAYKEDGQFQEARRCYEEALRIFDADAALDADRGATLDYLGNLEQVAGNLLDAQRLYTKALEIDQRFQDHTRIFTVFIHLAEDSIEQKHYKAAKKYLQSAAQQQDMMMSAKKESLADLYETQGWLASVTGKKGEAVEDYKRSVEACRDQYGNQHPLTGWTYLLLGKAFAEDGKVEDGMKSVREGIAILEETAGTSDLRYLLGQVLYSKLLALSGAQTESAQLASAAQQAIDNKLKHQCVNCTVSAWSFQQK